MGSYSTTILPLVVTENGQEKETQKLFNKTQRWVKTVFRRCGFPLEGKNMFSAVVCKIQARKRYIESIKEAASLKVKDPLYSCLLIACLPSRSRMLS